MRQRQAKAGLIVGCLLWLLAIPGFAADVCRSEPLQIQPKWISTLEFDSAANRILMADPKERELLAFRVGTRDMVKVPVPEEVAPGLISKIQGGFWVQSDTSAAILGAGPNASKPKIVSLQEAKKGSRITLDSLYSNWVTRGPAFIGFGSVSGASSDISRSPFPVSRRFQLGFVTGKVRSTKGRFENVGLLEATERNLFYLAGLQYFAANDIGLFYVRMVENRASIMRVRNSGRPQEVAAFPSDYRAVPRLNMTGSESDTAKAIYGSIEASTMAYGLFGQGKFLYLLTRQPNLYGLGTQWLLHKIDPIESRLLGAVRVPTTVNHLSVAVGPHEWYFIERGEVRDWADQDIKAVIRVPRSWIETPDTSPLDNTEPRVTQCSPSPSR